MFEIANLQLRGLETCGRLLDNAIKSSDADAGRKRRYHRSVLRSLGELRIHPADWRGVVDDNFKTLDDRCRALKLHKFKRLMVPVELVVIETLMLEAGRTLMRQACLSGSVSC